MHLSIGNVHTATPQDAEHVSKACPVIFLAQDYWGLKWPLGGGEVKLVCGAGSFSMTVSVCCLNFSGTGTWLREIMTYIFILYFL